MRRFYILLTALFILNFGWQSLTSAEEKRTYAMASAANAESLIKEVINKGNYPDSFFSKLTLPAGDLDVQGVQINEKDIVLLAKIKPNIIKILTDDPALPAEFLDKDKKPYEFSLGPYYLNYLFFLSTDMQLSSGKLYRKDTNVVPAILKRGTYLWYSGANGIFLESEEGHFLIAADSRLDGALRTPFINGPSLDKSASCSLNMSGSNEYRVMKCKVLETVAFQTRMNLAKDNKGFVINTPTNALSFK